MASGGARGATCSGRVGEELFILALRPVIMGTAPWGAALCCLAVQGIINPANAKFLKVHRTQPSAQALCTWAICTSPHRRWSGLCPKAGPLSSGEWPVAGASPPCPPPPLQHEGTLLDQEGRGSFSPGSSRDTLGPYHQSCPFQSP